ncbi:dimethylamine monooxygenase subunit DmmA family protein [Candidatus Mycolicibacterium alkanivorans]|uniref:Dimethylamine monooxygenase subunit DmmA-like C-terminal domain-containing protein n=1 Tax=Candidatus Mycolicibacterium alkanivorans TaxID=2954114 RepID=A0ABS9YYK6_9MYCO|nr:hypothetical protein [Candidatus Mycolicibacterium alkanivorans]
MASTEVGIREIFCAHCRTTTTARVELTGTLPCPGCGRELYVYYDVSRRLGAHLGFAMHADHRAAP